MDFEEGKLYHVYNRGNNREKIFFQDRNYEFFLWKVRKHILPFCNVLAYCLMPNHFHFLIRANHETIKIPEKGKVSKNQFSEGLRIMLTSYAQAINKQEGRVGSLFTQNTSAKAVQDWTGNYDYSATCFYYIHQNPLKSKLVSNLTNWPYASFLDYAGIRNGTLCNQKLTKRLIPFDWENFSSAMHDYQIPDSELKQIF